jgi:hypothetical protein
MNGRSKNQPMRRFFRSFHTSLVTLAAYVFGMLGAICMGSTRFQASSLRHCKRERNSKTWCAFHSWMSMPNQSDRTPKPRRLSRRDDLWERRPGTIPEPNGQCCTHGRVELSVSIFDPRTEVQVTYLDQMFGGKD